MVTQDTIFSIAPELKGETPETVAIFIDLARTRVSPDVWGKFTDQGVMYLAAHLITMKNRRGVGGAITQQKVGDLQVNNSDVQSGKKVDLDLLSTSYGQQYIQIRNLVVISPMSI
jgi:hypothetical protein